MNLCIIGTLCLFIINISLVGGGGHCYTKWKNGRWVSVGDCNNPSAEDVLEQLRKSVKAKDDLKTWDKSSNNYYYKLFRDPVNYATAKSSCQKLGADLASVGVRNAIVRSKILQMVKSGGENTWVGLDDIEHEGRFVWADGLISTRENTDWTAGQPDDYGENEDCGEFNRDQNWKLNDFRCSERQYYICEKGRF
ncbi:alpha-N-acetylgalactosamine-specific lectin-like [Styela clava]